MKRRMVAGIAGGALVLVLLGGEVWATHAQASASSAVSAQAAQQQQAPERKQGHMRVAYLLVKTTADVSKLTPKEVLAELRAGKSLDQVAQAHGTGGKAVVDAAQARLQARLNAAVAGGNIPQERADKSLQRFDQQAAKLMGDPTLGARFNQTRAARHPFQALLVKATADLSGVPVKMVQAELRAGKSLAQVAQEHQHTGQEVIQAARAKLQERLSMAVKSGKITQERADSALARFDKNAQKLVDATNVGKQK